jgi:hypothetical protein
MADGDPSPSSDESTPPESGSETQTTARNPVAGCIIIVVALLSLAFLVGFGIWNLFKLDRELAKFTEPEARPTAVPDLVAHAAVVNVLNSKVETFTTDAGNDRDATLQLTPEEINLAIAAFPPFEELRRTFSVESIEDGKMRIQISFPLRGSPTRKDESRYLNGTMVATPELAGGELILLVDRIDVPGKAVPDGFIGQLSPYRITKPYLENEALGPGMKRLTGLALADGSLTLRIAPGEAPPNAEAPELRDKHIFRFVALTLIVLLAFGGLVIYAAKRNRQMPQSD